MDFERRPVVVKTFAAATQAIAGDLFARDSVVATRLGYAATSQSWDGTKLTVVYQLQVAQEREASESTPVTRMDANARANQERAAANAIANQTRAEANAQANQERAQGRESVAVPSSSSVPPQ